MAVKIGHASKTEYGGIKNGKAGDQTGSEVCTRSWYNKSWGFVLRPINTEFAEKTAVACEKGCANANIGYDQNNRNTLYYYANEVGFDLSKITIPCECDCSSFMHVCAIAGGANIPYGTNGATTRTMRTQFVQSGMYKVLTDNKYRTSDKYLKRGDILVKAGSHTVMVLENGAKVTQSATETVKSTYTKTQFIKDVQSATDASVDGIAGKETLSKTITISKNRNRKHSVVKAVQKYLNSLGYSCGTADGVFGSKTHDAVCAYQKANGCTTDGEITARQKTWKKLLGLA